MSHPRCPVCNKFIKTNIKRYRNIQDDQPILFGQPFPLNIHIDETEKMKHEQVETENMETDCNEKKFQRR
jgi:hypothetical protein